MFVITVNAATRLIFFLLIEIIIGPLVCFSQNYPYTDSTSRIRSPYEASSYSNLGHSHQPNFPNYGSFSSRSGHSDSRCPEQINNLLFNDRVTVGTRFGEFTGHYAYLCDFPDVKATDRFFVNNLHRYNSNFIRNVTVFLGIPYASPPLVELGLRFKVITHHLTGLIIFY